jgi:hypothetical protein
VQERILTCVCCFTPLLSQEGQESLLRLSYAQDRIAHQAATLAAAAAAGAAGGGAGRPASADFEQSGWRPRSLEDAEAADGADGAAAGAEALAQQAQQQGGAGASAAAQAGREAGTSGASGVVQHSVHSVPAGYEYDPATGYMKSDSSGYWFDANTGVSTWVGGWVGGWVGEWVSGGTCGVHGVGMGRRCTFCQALQACKPSRARVRCSWRPRSYRFGTCSACRLLLSPAAAAVGHCG